LYFFCMYCDRKAKELKEKKRRKEEKAKWHVGFGCSAKTSCFKIQLRLVAQLREFSCGWFSMSFHPRDAAWYTLPSTRAHEILHDYTDTSCRTSLKQCDHTRKQAGGMLSLDGQHVLRSSESTTISAMVNRPNTGCFLVLHPLFSWDRRGSNIFSLPPGNQRPLAARFHI
jgi:hypothetical protein